jgi:hypothetical protein
MRLEVDQLIVVPVLGETAYYLKGVPHKSGLGAHAADLFLTYPDT